MKLNNLAGRIIESTLVHITATYASRFTQDVLDRTEEGVAWAKGKLKEIQQKNNLDSTTPPAKKSAGETDKSI